MSTQKTKTKTVNATPIVNEVSVLSKVTTSPTTVWILTAITILLLMVNGCNSCSSNKQIKALSSQINQSDSLHQLQYNNLVKDLGAYVATQSEISNLKGKDEGKKEESRKQLNITVKTIQNEEK